MRDCPGNPEWRQDFPRQTGYLAAIGHWICRTLVRPDVRHPYIPRYEIAPRPLAVRHGLGRRICNLHPSRIWKIQGMISPPGNSTREILADWMQNFRECRKSRGICRWFRKRFHEQSAIRGFPQFHLHNAVPAGSHMIYLVHMNTPNNSVR